MSLDLKNFDYKCTWDISKNNGVNDKLVYQTYGWMITKSIEKALKTFVNRSRIVCMIKQSIVYKN